MCWKMYLTFGGKKKKEEEEEEAILDDQKCFNLLPLWVPDMVVRKSFINGLISKHLECNFDVLIVWDPLMRGQVCFDLHPV